LPIGVPFNGTSTLALWSGQLNMDYVESLCICFIGVGKEEGLGIRRYRSCQYTHTRSTSGVVPHNLKVPPYPIPHTPYPIPHTPYPIPHTPYPLPWYELQCNAVCVAMRCSVCCGACCGVCCRVSFRHGRPLQSLDHF